MHHSKWQWLHIGVSFKLIGLIKEIDWHVLESAATLDEKAERFSTLMNEAMDAIAPKKQFKIKPKYVHGLSPETREIMKRRDQARGELKHNPMEKSSYTQVPKVKKPG